MALQPVPSLFPGFMRGSPAVLSPSKSQVSYTQSYSLPPCHLSMFPHILRFFHPSFQHCCQQIPEFIDVIAWLVIQQKYQIWQNKNLCSTKVSLIFTQLCILRMFRWIICTSRLQSGCAQDNPLWCRKKVFLHQ